ncbi:hypothetical protein BGZ65_002146, partial [Modicella reniformis]
GRQPKFAQIYIYDPEQQIDIRLANYNRPGDQNSRNLEGPILLDLQQALEAVNRFCALYRSIREHETGSEPAELRFILRADQTVPEEPEEQERRVRARGRVPRSCFLKDFRPCLQKVK